MDVNDTAPACAVSDLPPPGGCVKVGEDDSAVAIFNDGGHYFAVQDLCTHDCSSLSEEGWFEEGVVECGWHRARFDLQTGDVLSPPARVPLRVFDIVIAGDAAHLVERRRT